MKIKLYILVFLLSTSLFAQKVTTSIDTTKNKIGAEFKLTLKTTVDTASRVTFSNAKNFGNLEVIRSYPIDTIKKDNVYELIKKYGLTQFDSGKYVVPRILVLINKKSIFSDSIAIEVNDVKVDTLKQKMHDIKDIIPAESGIGNWWKYLLGFLLIIGLGFLVYYFIKKRQAKKLEEVVYKTPIEKATSLIKILETKQLWQKGEIKTYYSELTDITRNYIEEEIQVPAMESTTSELIQALRKVANQKKLKLSKETLVNLEKVLKQADLVKFAKSKPLDFEIEEDKNRIVNSIITIHKSIPEVKIEEGESALDELQKEKLLKAKKSKRVFWSVFIVIAVLFITLITLVLTKGVDFVKDSLLGHPTKELVEGEWVYSEYGNPAIKIETPKVLKRTDVSASLPKEGLALIKEMQTFTYGSMLDNFFLSVSTFKYKQEGEIDLNKVLDGSIQMMEARGAINILIKPEEFSTPQGVNGIRGAGSLSMTNPLDKTKNNKMHYETLIFNQNGGLQQIIIMYQNDDQYAEIIAKRVLNSVELTKINE
ncbi:MAG: hypothetical protein O9267_12080 [Flavobacterium sp.]|uniref:hypothetical protein n=1 Tax=Flavobacterium sp. TaxID=239 RepID=UPI0022BC06C8|nr:hypothetical protein [Flavobacterium sp.]MCZ8198334.1 hypothetical protein [Flavobacterium sp.]